MCKAFILLFFPLLLCGQVRDVPLVMYATGPIDYEGGTPGTSVSVYTGTYLTGQGALSLGEDATLEAVSGDRFVRLSEPGRYPISELFEQEPKSDGFIDRFINFVRRGLDQSASTEDLEHAYQENQGNISGLGDAGLSGLLPFGGSLFPVITTFTWPEDDAATSYRLRVVDSLTEAVVLTATARDTSVQLDLAGLYLQDDRRYYWEVFPNAAPSNTPSRLGAQAPAVAGTRIYFTFRTRDRSEVLAPVTELSIYRGTASEAQRRLLEAMALEEADYLYAADRAYRDGLAQEPDNPVIRRAYAAFLSRWNQRSRARTMIQLR
ncbi:hypothetical protein GGR28_002713 [Lewinella aquimaris]|uniref:Uncharacterized protein n=1 Tax=Neolewinella aquimaris TaxID=1835722 RepID=A0A840E833_9BACT|nr:hypothetical protein [Neolewinella aquimaris]MBB4080083.1 hypothetical protein [Neolewinella aquimaris]